MPSRRCEKAPPRSACLLVFDFLPPIPNLKNVPDLAPLITVLLRLTRLGLRLMKRMLLADEASNDVGVFFHCG